MSRYREIAAQLREAIRSGEYQRGEALPSETELAARHHVSRPVVNHALQTLQNEGLVRIERGRGTIVHEIPPLVRRAAHRHRKAAREEGGRGPFGAEITRLGHTPRTDVVRVGPVTPPRHVAELLDFTERDQVAAVRERQMYADDVPVQLATSYVPWDLAAGTAITQPDAGPGGTYARLAEQDSEVVRWRERVRSRPPSEEEREFFRISPDQRVHEAERIAYTAAGRPVEVTVMILPAHQWILEYEWGEESATR